MAEGTRILQLQYLLLATPGTHSLPLLVHWASNLDKCTLKTHCLVLPPLTDSCASPHVTRCWRLPPPNPCSLYSCRLSCLQNQRCCHHHHHHRQDGLAKWRSVLPRDQSEPRRTARPNCNLWELTNSLYGPFALLKDQVCHG